MRAEAQQETEFDGILKYLEEKDLLEYWRKTNQTEKATFLIDFARRWLPVSQLSEYEKRTNVIYLLYNSRTKQIYVGKANKLGDRVKKGRGRTGLDHDWDKFMFFEVNPEFVPLIEKIEAFTIRSLASILENDVDSVPLKDKNIKLVNRHLRNRST